MSATKKALSSGFLTSLMFKLISLVEIFDKFFLILSTSEPFFPITKPGLDVKIETMHFLVVLSITTLATPEFKIFFFNIVSYFKIFD